MGQRVKLAFGVLLWLLSATAWGSLSDRRPHGILIPWLRSGLPKDGRPHPVTVQCKEARMVVTVQRDLFGTGRLIKAADLSLGPASCKPKPAAGDAAATFDVGLHECGTSLQMTPDLLVYSTHLSYNPTTLGNQAIIRSNPAVIPIQCTYPRTGNVSSKAIKPTWAPFSSTIFAEERLAFSLRLMNDDWSAERTSTEFHLGDEIHIEASVKPGDHAPLTVFIDSCVATVSPDKDSSPRYRIVDSYGCLVDGKQEDSYSSFRSPRSQPEKLQFSVDAFRFPGDIKSSTYITCSLRAAAADQTPDPMHKACSFSKTSHMWTAVEGPSNICNCCETTDCGVLGQPRGLRPFFPVPRRIGKRSVTSLPDVADVQLRPISVLQAVPLEASHEGGSEPQGMTNFWMVTALVIAVLTLLLSAALGLMLFVKRGKHF
ncbi:zona pellucida sperm-binding protein 3-like [Rhinatrema bivittatum]|uniref:zona pellucida sperm-binding protein 3-like n=1 Tax=Rhinatrema bivittatum TaxID=194408 RepID=UPI00112C66F4|nr:zona pellucida sperm-binding protein 3-like [Rhinatrema bivittatum]